MTHPVRTSGVSTTIRSKAPDGSGARWPDSPGIERGSPGASSSPATCSGSVRDDAQRQFAGRMSATTIEVPTNHVAMVSHPDEVVNLITTAAQAVPAAT
jgi:hypothetical protein